MATYLELADLYDNANLLRKVEVALLIKAQTYLDAGAPTAAQRSWARHVFEQPGVEARLVMKYLLAKNNAAQLSAITNASDATVQSAVDGVANQLVSAFAGA